MVRLRASGAVALGAAVQRVARTAQRLDHVAAELLAKPADQDLDAGAGRFACIAPPHVEQLTARGDAAGAIGQELEDRPLARGDWNIGPGASRATAREIECDI